jgi:hypothetical protein
MIIPTTTRMNLKLKLIPCVYSVSLLVLLGCFLVYPSYSDAQETETTKNLLTNPGFEAETNTSDPTGWTATGSGNVCDTCGPYGGNAIQSGNESTGGGTVSQTIDLFDEMSQDQVNAGFDIEYGGDIFSNSSNAYAPSCSATKGDCRDTFSITLTINDASGNQLHKFEHEYEEITWTGWDTSTYDFSQTIPENNYTSALATLEFFGIDSGYTSGTYGPALDNAFLKLTYTTQAVLDSIQDAVNVAVDIAADTAAPTDTFEVNVTDSMGAEIESFSVEVNTDSGGGSPEVSVTTSVDIPEIRIETPQMDMPAPSVQEVQVEAQVEQVEAQIESEVEAQVEAQVEVAEAAPEPEASSEPETTSEPEASSESENTQENTQESETKNDGNGDSKNDGDNKSEAKEDKKETKQKIATNIVTAIIQKMDNSPASQATQLALMNVIGANYKDTVSLTDNSTWYQSDVIYNEPQLIDPAASLFEGAQSEMMNDLISSQYGR